MIKLIASDMDGTLLNNNHDIDEETVRAIKFAEEKGIMFAIATGREYGSVKEILDKHNIKAPCILSNGAEYRDIDGNILEAINIDEEKSREILKILEYNRLSARIFTNEGVYTSSTEEEALKEIIYRAMSMDKTLSEEEAKKNSKEINFFKELKYIESVDKLFNEKIEIRKFVAFHSDIDLINKVKEEIRKIEGVDVTSSFSENIEITHSDAQKGLTLKKIAEKLKIKKEEVLILGDSLNDYSMFEVFEETVAMKNAITEVKEIAKYITDYNDNLGVAKAIEKVVNNDLDKILKSK